MKDDGEIVAGVDDVHVKEEQRGLPRILERRLDRVDGVRTGLAKPVVGGQHLRPLRRASPGQLRKCLVAGRDDPLRELAVLDPGGIQIVLGAKPVGEDHARAVPVEAAIGEGPLGPGALRARQRRAAPSSVARAMASYPPLILRRGQSTDSAISSGDRHAPAVVSSGPTMPPSAPTLWHEVQLKRASRNTSAPRRESPSFRAAATSVATSIASFVGNSAFLAGRGVTGVRGFGAGPGGLPSSWGSSQSSPSRLSSSRASASSSVWPRMPIGPR